MWRYDGSDFAHFQDEAGALIDFDALRSASDWAATKVSQRNNYVDPTAERHRSEMRRCKFRHRGLYHWQSPTSEASISSQVANWKRGVGGSIEVGEYFMGDCEQVGITEPDTFEMCQRVEHEITGRPSALYFGIYTAGGTLVRSERLRMSEYGERAIHIAAYVTEARLAFLLAQAGLTGLRITANQFGSSGVMPNGQHVPGVTGRVDMNQINDVVTFDLCSGITKEEEMSEIYYNVTGANAKFIGCPTRVRWSGGGDKIEQAIAWQLALSNLVQEDLTGGPGAFAATWLDGDLPVGDTLYNWTGDEFANSAEIKARQQTRSTVDDVARQGVAVLQTAVVALQQKPDSTIDEGARAHADQIEGELITLKANLKSALE